MATLTILGTTDLHGAVIDWDYFTDAPFATPAGLSRIATAVAQIRAENPGGVLLFDVGDTIQGNPLAYHCATSPADIHPIAATLNAVGVKAAAVGNHEFNYGLDTLRHYERSCDFPLLAANARQGDGTAFRASTMIDIDLPEIGAVRVGVLGLTTPGTAIWDRDVVAGVLTFDDIVATARREVPALRAAGTDIVVVLSHSGLGPSSSYGDRLAFPENATADLGRQVDGIDAILFGHAHVEIATMIKNDHSDIAVPAVEALSVGLRLARIDLQLERAGATIRVLSSSARSIDVGPYDESPAVLEIIRTAHEATRRSVAETISHTDQPIATRGANLAPSRAIDLVNHAQAAAVREALRDTPYAGHRICSVTAVIARGTGIDPGPVSIRDIAAIYPFDNSLHAITMTGRQLLEYLEFSATYFRHTGDPHDPEWIANAPRDDAPLGVPDFNYDILGFADAVTRYDIDLAATPGARIRGLRIDEDPIAPDEEFVVAMSNYRAAGGGNYPHTADATPILVGTEEIRDLVIDWVRRNETLDAPTRTAWRLTVGEQPFAPTAAID